VPRGVDAAGLVNVAVGGAAGADARRDAGVGDAGPGDGNGVGDAATGVAPTVAVSTGETTALAMATRPATAAMPRAVAWMAPRPTWPLRTMSTLSPW